MFCGLWHGKCMFSFRWNRQRPSNFNFLEFLSHRDITLETHLALRRRIKQPQIALNPCPRKSMKWAEIYNLLPWVIFFFLEQESCISHFCSLAIGTDCRISWWLREALFTRLGGEKEINTVDKLSPKKLADETFIIPHSRNSCVF